MIIKCQNLASELDKEMVDLMADLSSFMPPENFTRAVFVIDKEDASISTYFKRAPSEDDLQFDSQIKRFIRDRLCDDWQLSLYTFVESFDDIGLHGIHFVYDTEEEG